MDSDCTEDRVTVRIIDDGRGFSQHVIGRIGDPFITFNSPASDREKRPEYQGMGLGLFIAKTLLERSGAELTFANARESYSLIPEPGMKRGAIVEIVWPRAEFCVEENESREGLGANAPISV